ncbi:ABC transporter [Phytophthora infestans]|uniref:ABC transporter n=1 Tax=Phytophthora infestans TaxID=4787 RepID=A0A8S9UNQ8_PHYIN|nr:ABC transporter [Phytophthora infestans]
MSSPTNHFIQVNDTPKTRGFAPEPAKFTLQWRNLSLKAEVKNPATKKTEEKVILNNVSGSAKPGELLVIMGPSGAGKSSLLDCISGRKSGVEGEILLNSQPWTKATKRMASYVMQDDLFYETLTVKEHLTFQAKLRIGKTYTKDEYMRRVDEVMEELGLMKCRDTFIGGESLRGISGGERKRLSFATEILTSPSILFADEPTSGLDSFMAETVIKQLQQIARDGRTVLATIHQPSSEVFAIFDQLYLLSDGSPVYQGKASESVDYFSSLGYPCPPQINPSESARGHR